MPETGGRTDDPAPLVPAVEMICFTGGKIPVKRRMAVVFPADTGTAVRFFSGNAASALYKKFAIERGPLLPPGMETGTAENIIETLFQSGGEITGLQQLLDHR